MGDQGGLRNWCGCVAQDRGIPARVTLDQPEGWSGGLTEAARVHVPRRHRAEAEALLAEVDKGR